MMVAVARLVQVDWEWALATSLFQPDSQGSVPAATLTLARLMSPALCSMPGWVNVDGAASAVVAVAETPAPRVRAAVRPPAVLSRPRRLNSVLGRCSWGEVRLIAVHLQSVEDQVGAMLTSSNSVVQRTGWLR